jgi:hypothetical protein
MEPVIALNYMAIALSVVLGMVLGFVWFSVLFDKAWARHMGMEDVPQPDGAAMGKSMVIFFVSNVLIVYVLAHTLGVWRASAWGLTSCAGPLHGRIHVARVLPAATDESRRLGDEEVGARGDQRGLRPHEAIGLLLCPGVFGVGRLCLTLPPYGAPCGEAHDRVRVPAQ